MALQNEEALEIAHRVNALFSHRLKENVIMDWSS